MADIFKILSNFAWIGNIRSGLVFARKRLGRMTMVPQADPADFMRLYSQYETRIRGYVRSLVPRWSDAEDITQQCNLIIWEQFHKYEPGTNFFRLGVPDRSIHGPQIQEKRRAA